jgi:hypothetical protein
MSKQDFVALMASAYRCEGQNFRVSLLDYFALQFPSAAAGANITTANEAIELAQRDIVTAFVRHKVAR